MNSKTITPATVSKAKGARVTVAEQSAAAIISAAKHSEESLSSLLTSATLAGSVLITDRFGAEIDSKRDPRAAVKLALAVARKLADPSAKLPSGDAGQNVRTVISAIQSGGQTPTDAVLVECSRARLDALAAAKRDATALKNGLKADLVDPTKSLESRAAALEQIAEIEGNESRAKSDAAWLALSNALAKAYTFGFTIEQVHTLTDSAYNVGI